MNMLVGMKFINLANLKMKKIAYKAVLPPAKESIGQMIAAFANTSGGYIVLGVVESQNDFVVNGLSEDFHAISVTHKAIDLLSPKPNVSYEYLIYQTKRLYVIKVEKSTQLVSIEGKIYIRQGGRVILTNPPKKETEAQRFINYKTINNKTY